MSPFRKRLCRSIWLRRWGWQRHVKASDLLRWNMIRNLKGARA